MGISLGVGSLSVATVASTDLRPLDHQDPQKSRWYTHFLQGSEARIKDALVLSMDPD